MLRHSLLRLYGLRLGLQMRWRIWSFARTGVSARHRDRVGDEPVVAVT